MLHNHQQSCGCLRVESGKSRRIDITGKKVGILEVIGNPIYNDKGQILWECACKCGNKNFWRLGSLLRSEIVKSCGCFRRRKGKDNPNYLHEISVEERLRRKRGSINMPGYKNWARDVKIRDNLTCQVCDIKDTKFEAHHLYNYKDYPEYASKIDNGVTLCQSCHIKFHQEYGKDYNNPDQFEEFKEKYGSW